MRLFQRSPSPLLRTFTPISKPRATDERCEHIRRNPALKQEPEGRRKRFVSGKGSFQGRRSAPAARCRCPRAARCEAGSRPTPRGSPPPAASPPPPSFPTLSLLLHHFLSPPAPLPLTSAPLPLPGRPAAALASPSASSSPSALAHPLGLSAAPCWPRCSRFPWSGAPSPQGSRSGGRPCCLLRPLLQPRHRRDAKPPLIRPRGTSAPRSPLPHHPLLAPAPASPLPEGGGKEQAAPARPDHRSSARLSQLRPAAVPALLPWNYNSQKASRYTTRPLPGARRALHTGIRSELPHSASSGFSHCGGYRDIWAKASRECLPAGAWWSSGTPVAGVQSPHCSVYTVPITPPALAGFLRQVSRDLENRSQA